MNRHIAKSSHTKFSSQKLQKERDQANNKTTKKSNQAQSFISIYVNLNIKYDVVTNKKLNKFMYLHCG